MTLEAQPSTAALVLEAVRLNARPWDEVSAGIPEWHPRNESGGGAPAAAGGQGEGSGEGGAEGADAGGDPSALFGPYLSDVPAELQHMVLPSLQAQNADFTRRFQEAKDFRNQMEPYSKIDGFSDTSPEEVSELLALRQVLSDPEQAKAWIQDAAQTLGLQPEIDEATWTQIGEQNQWLAGDEPSGQEDQSAQLQALLDEKLAPFQEFIQQQQQQTQEQQAEQERQQLMQGYDARLNELLTDHGLADAENVDDVRAHVIELAFAYANQGSEDPIGDAMQRHLSITGQAQGDLLDRKLESKTGRALSGGQPGEPPQMPSWNGNGPSPKDLALARMRQ